MVDVHFQAVLLSLSVYFDPIIQLFLIRARDPLSYNERLGEDLQESGRRRGGAIHNQLRNYLIEPSSVGEIASTTSSGFASMTPINVEDPIHEQFRQSSALGEMERYIVSNYVYCSFFFTLLRVRFSLLTTSKLLLLLSSTLTSYFTQLLLTTTVVYLKLMLLF